MKYTKSTRYALYAAMEMAQASGTVTVGEVATKYRISQGALAKVFQQLVRSGLARGVRGIGGGYVLAKPPAQITVQDVIQVHEIPFPKGRCLLDETDGEACHISSDCRLRLLFEEVDELVYGTFASVSLETLVRPDL